MGQYYRGVIFSDKDYKKIKENKSNLTCSAAYCPYDFDNGSKLMEHSYIGDAYVAIYEQMLSGQFKGARFIWCGDYADDIRKLVSKKEGIKIDTRKSNEITAYTIGDKYTDKHETEQRALSASFDPPTMLCRFLINYDKKEYVDLFKAAKNIDKWGCVIHPLPLLTCSGNGRGGGDYRGRNMRLVGSWALDHIGLVRWDDRIDKEFKEITPNFREKR